jgi:phospholipid/cholesterol/gamma-HCH transport system substrate-binding protein
MRKSHALNLGTGTFVVLGFAALFFLTTQTTNHGLSLTSKPHYDVTAKFDNIDFDSNEYKAVVLMRLSARYNKIPTDSDASIYTQGLLGGKFIGLTAGGADTYLKDKDHIDFTQSAFVLENLIGQLLANFAKSGHSDSGKSDADSPPPAAPKANPEPLKEKAQ